MTNKGIENFFSLPNKEQYRILDLAGAEAYSNMVSVYCKDINWNKIGNQLTLF